jgi:hypothetical protein
LRAEDSAPTTSASSRVVVGLVHTLSKTALHYDPEVDGARFESCAQALEQVLCLADALQDARTALALVGSGPLAAKTADAGLLGACGKLLQPAFEPSSSLYGNGQFVYSVAQRVLFADSEVLMRLARLIVRVARKVPGADAFLKQCTSQQVGWRWGGQACG